DQLLQSVFLDMFGDPVTNPKGWPVRPLGDLVRLDASLVDPREPQFCHLLHYGPDRIETDTGRLLPALTAEQDGLISKKFLCDQRHVLYSKIRPYLNKVAMVDRECLCSADVYPVEPIAEKILKRFLFQMLKSPAMLDHAAQFSNRANIPKINRNQLLSFRCISPPLELQRSFDSLASRVQALAAGVRGSTNKLDSLTAAINQRAFSRSPGKSL
ncbi:MAG: restriction endonuclease subunit S, partial [Xanthomonadales bacterium]|nr:restriction endonuclease subunit S [Xanthomonadales bacterium]